MRCSPRLFPSLCFLVATFWLGTSAWAADLYKVGSRFDGLSTKDQHGLNYTFKAGETRLILVSFDMTTGKKANTWLAKQPASFLSSHRAILINNIYGMPGVGRIFALPKMKKYPHRILLADADGFLDRFPATDNQLTVIRLDPAGVITAINRIDPAKEMPAIFGPK
jgi:hypothetical protein